VFQFDSERARRRRPWWTITLVALAACALGVEPVAPTKPMLVLHGVLNPGASTQIVLLERTRSGTVTIIDTIVYSTADPIVSDGGIPVRGATVELRAPSGQVFTGFEDAPAQLGGGGAGVYRFSLSGGALLRGQDYALHLRTAEGEEASATTSVPAGSPSTVAPLATFDRDRDTVIVSWSASAGARSYLLRIESPFGPFFLFTDTTHVRLSGQLRNLFANELTRVFIPGFQQLVSVTAVDSNFYDYYRTSNDPFTGSGLINRVKGGIGLFGAAVVVDMRALDVVATPKDPIEGRYVYVTVPGETPPATSLRLYVESHAVRSDAASILSGNYATGLKNRPQAGLLGTFISTRVRFGLLVNQTSGDTVAVFTGELRGDSLVGSYRGKTTPAIFVKVP
jgi:Domain of unknown function (DUF4249)